MNINNYPIISVPTRLYKIIRIKTIVIENLKCLNIIINKKLFLKYDKIQIPNL